LHYEWTLSLRLRPDAPASFLAELRFHLEVQDGHAYIAEPGGSVAPLDDGAPPFTLSHTSDAT